jgi:hypothetical protein
MRGTAVIAGGRAYHVVPDIAARDRVFVLGRVVDDADGRAMAREVQITSPEPLLFSARSEDQIGLAGYPGVSFVDRSVSHVTSVTLGADGYRIRTQEFTIPAFAPLPHRVDLSLRALPFTLSGRIYGRTVGPTPVHVPLAGARIALAPVPAPGGEVPLMLRQPLRADPAVGATIRRRAMAAQADLTAIADAGAGEGFVAVADATTVAAGQVLRAGPDQQRFYAVISQIIVHPDLPAPAALLRLTEGLLGSVPAGAVIARFVPGGFSGSDAGLVGDAFAGEAVVWLDALPASGGALVVRAAGQPDRYHDADVVSGPAGDYRCLGLSRIGTPMLEVSAAGLTTDSTTFRVATLRTGPVDWYLVP